MTTEGGYSQEVEPLMMEETPKLNEWSPHNDAELAHQKKVLNLDNRHVRLTLWCLVYVVVTVAQYANNMYNYILYNNMYEERWTANEIDDELEYYSLGISTNSILWLTAGIFLCSLYCACCKMNCNTCTAILFIVGSILSFATMIHGAQKECTDGGPAEQFGVGYCRSLFVGSGIFLAAFSLYLAVDIIKSIGNDIRVRLFVKSLLVSLQSYLLFAYWNKVTPPWNEDLEPGMYYSYTFAYNTLAGGHLTCGIVCSLIVLVMVIGYASPNKKIHPFVSRLLCYILLSGTGSTMILGLGLGNAYSQLSSYYVVAAG
eukprot:168984_1